MTAYSGVSWRATWVEEYPVEFAVLEEMANCPFCSDGDGDYPCEVCWENCLQHPNGTTCPICSQLVNVVPLTRMHYRPMIRFKDRAADWSHPDTLKTNPEWQSYWDDWRRRRAADDTRIGSWHTLSNGNRHPLEMIKTDRGYRCVCSADDPRLWIEDRGV